MSILKIKMTSANEVIMLMIGGALIEKLKPILDEFKRWRVLLEVPYGAQKDRYKSSVLDRS
jgi:hypothetical protein